MERIYEELDEVKLENEKLKADYKNKVELFENLKRIQNEQLIKMQEFQLMIEKQNDELEEKRRELCVLKQTNEDLIRSLNEKDSILKCVSDANDKLRANGEERYQRFEEERGKLMLVLNETNEKNTDQEQKINVYRSEIEGLKRIIAESEKKLIEAEKNAKISKEMKERDNILMRIEDEKIQVEETLKWKKEQFKHLEEAYEKLRDEFKRSKKEWEKERFKLLNEISSMDTKLDSQNRIIKDLQKKLQLCNNVMTQEETRRKRLEVEVSELKLQYKDASAAWQDTRSKLDDLTVKRDEEIAALRYSLSTKETYYKEMKYQNEKLEQDKIELLISLKEFQEACIRGSGKFSLLKSKNKRRKEDEWSSQVEKMADEINAYKLQLERKEIALKEVKMELEYSHSSLEEMKLQYEETLIMFLVLTEFISDVKCEKIIDENRGEIEDQNLEMQKEVKRQKELLKKSSKCQTRMEEKLKEIEKKLRKVCVALDNANAKLLEEREKQSLLEKEINKYKEMLEESDKTRVRLEERILQIECDSKKKLEGKLASIQKYEEKRRKEESIRYQLNLKKNLEEVLMALEKVNSDANELELELWIWKSIAERLKDEQNQKNLCKTLEASAIDDVSSSSEIEKEILREKEKMLEDVEREVNWYEQELFRREFEGVAFTHITEERKLEIEREIHARIVKNKDEQLHEMDQEFKNSLKSFSSILEQKQTEFDFVYEAWKNMAESKIFDQVEIEEKKMMLIELEGEIVKTKQILETSNDLLDKLSGENTNLQDEILRLSSERDNLWNFVDEFDNELSNLF